MAARWRLPDSEAFYARGIKRAAEIEGTTVEEPKKESTMKLKKPVGVSNVDEDRYLTHCKNIARIVSVENGSLRDRIKLYVSVTGAELADADD